MYGILKAYGANRNPGDVVHKQDLAKDSKGKVTEYPSVDAAYQDSKKLREKGGPDIINVVELDGSEYGKPLSPRDAQRIQLLRQGVPLPAR